MTSNRLIFTVAIVGLAILSTRTPALEPIFNLSRAVHPEAGPAAPGVPSGPRILSDACPATDLGEISGAAQVIGSTAGSVDDFDASAWPCSEVFGGRDEIFQFTVDSGGQWEFSTCNTANFDTSLGLHVESGGGCPGDFLACNGDGGGCGGCGGFTSLFQTALSAGVMYYIVVDGWSTYTYGDFELNITDVSCTSDADCDDGDFCNGVEQCDLASGECQPGQPCPPCWGPCNPDDIVPVPCEPPDLCLTWRAGAGSGFFFPQSAHCLTASWTFDDIQTSKHTTDLPRWYDLPFIARTTPTGASPLGTVYLVDLALWTVTDDGACNPLANMRRIS